VVGTKTFDGYLHVLLHVRTKAANIHELTSLLRVVRHDVLVCSLGFVSSLSDLQHKSVLQNAEDTGIVGFVLYGCEMWFLSLREYHMTL
jgi:hypothetical protein